MESHRSEELLRQAEKNLIRVFRHHDGSIDIERRAEKLLSHVDQAADLSAVLYLDGRNVQLDIEVKSRLTSEVIERFADQRDKNGIRTRILFAPSIQPALQKQLREKKVNFVDLKGNVFLRAPGVRIDVVGRGGGVGNLLPKTEVPVNPFGKKASRVVRALWELSVDPIRERELAAYANVSPSWAYKIIEEMKARGYAQENSEGVLLADPARLLKDWSNAYEWTRNSRQTFFLPFPEGEVVGRLKHAFEKYAVDWALTLTAGARYRVGYVSDTGMYEVYAMSKQPPALRNALEELHAERVESGGNLMLLSPPYYGSGVFRGLNRESDLPLVSDLQLFLDLRNYPVRGPETAEVLLQRRIVPKLKLSHSRIRELIKDLG